MGCSAEGLERETGSGHLPTPLASIKRVILADFDRATPNRLSTSPDSLCQCGRSVAADCRAAECSRGAI
jgi:hypothetical protein